MAKRNPNTKLNILVGEENLGAIEHEQDIGLDLETSGLSPWRDKIAVISVMAPKSKTPLIMHVRGKISPRLKKWLGTRKRITLHNGAGFDLLLMHEAGIDVFSPDMYDTMLGELALLTTDRRDVSVSLKSTMYRRTGKKISKDADHAGWMNPKLTEAQINYCVDDIKELINLREAQLKRADDDQRNAISVEQSLIPVLVKMSCNGVPIDLNKLKLFLKDQDKSVVATTKRLSQKLGFINFGSHVQLKKALVQANPAWELKSTAAEVLEEIIMYPGELSDICKDLLELRHAAQRKKMYQPDWINKHVVDGIIHPRFWSCSTDTGRMSSSDPNFQQVPADMRSIYGGRPGYKVVWADLSQAEIRVAAAVANCPGLRRVFAEGLHVHTDIASKSFRVDYDKVDDQLKKLAKGLTFTMLFGGAWETFQMHARQAGVDLSDQECMKIFKDFFNAYPGMKELKKSSTSMCRKHKFSGRPLELRLPTGLKRFLVGWKIKPSVLMNTLIQGGAAAAMKFALLEAHRRGLTEYLSASIHDELMAGWVPNKMADEYGNELVEVLNYGMDQVMENVPSEAIYKVGDYWGK